MPDMAPQAQYAGARKMAKSKAHPGFAAVAKQAAARQGISMKRARAEIAAGARKASPAAKRANPRLEKVSGA